MGENGNRIDDHAIRGVYGARVGQQEIALTEDRNTGESQNFVKWWANRIIKFNHVRQIANLKFLMSGKSQN